MQADEIKVKIHNRGSQALPAYETPEAAGMDMRADIPAPITLQPLQRALVPTGLCLQLPRGYQCEIRPRSGLAIKHGITVLNSPGTVDADYRGEIKAIIINLGSEPFTINPGERICQMVVTRYTRVKWEPVSRLDTTERGSGGFGHSGLD